METPKWLSLLPEALLLLSLPIMLIVKYFRESQTAKTFYTLAKVFLVLSLVSGLIFYDFNGYPHWLMNNQYTILFKLIIGLLSMAWFFLSLKWFLNKDENSAAFYALSMVSLTLLFLLISAQNLILVGTIGVMLMGCNFLMLRLNPKTDEETFLPRRRYLVFSLFFAAVLILGCVMLYQEVGSLSYEDISAFLAKGQINAKLLAAIVCIIASLLYLAALAPFHFWMTDVIGTAILPVGGFLSIIPAFAFFGCLADLLFNVFMPLKASLQPLLTGFAVLSVVLGALSANNENNIRRLFSYAGLYNLGLVYLCLAGLNDNSLLSAFVYLLVYILSLSGIYTVFFGFKAKGDYLTDLPDISGIAADKPYISAAFLVFMISLIGSPPLLGFLGILSLANNLVLQGSYILLAVVLVSLLLVANAYLRVIQTVYFEDCNEEFDRVDNGIYICLFINLIIVIVSLLNPGYLLHDAEKILFTIF